MEDDDEDWDQARASVSSGRRALGTGLSRADPAPPPGSAAGEMHLHTALFLKRRGELTRKAVDAAECIRTRVAKYMGGDARR